MDKHVEIARREARRAKARAQLAAVLDSMADTADKAAVAPYARAYAGRSDGTVRPVAPRAFYNVKMDY